MEDTRAQTYTRLGESLKAERGKWDYWWDELRSVMLPRRWDDVEVSGGVADWRRRNNSVSNLACQNLAAAHVAFITPSDKSWFAFKPHEDVKTDKSVGWCGMVTKIVRQHLADSNFYSEVHECYLDRCSLGIGALLCEERDNGALNFVNVPCGTFACAQNSYGEIDTFVRWFKFSAAQIVQRFGRDGKIADEKIQDAYDDEKRRYAQDFALMHIVRPRPKYDPKRGVLDATQRPYESVYVCEETKNILLEDGYYEFPYLVTRFVRWGSGPYGCPPGYFVMDEIKDVMFSDHVLNVLAEVAAFPRILELADQVGEIDMRAGGRTTVSPAALDANLPREWATAGRYDVALDRMKAKEEIIEAAFFKPMIQVISSVEREMTATEVVARENEKILAFSPSFTLLTSDLSRFFKRIFALLGRAEKFPDPPEELRIQKGDMALTIPPVVRFTGKIAVALERIQSEGMMYAFGTIANFAGVAPDMLDVFNKRKIAKDLARTAGTDEDCLVSDEDIAALDQQRAEQQQMQQQMQLAQMGAAAAKDGSQAINQLQGGGKA